MADPLAEIIQLLRPQAIFAKGVSAAGPWAVSYSAFGHPGFCAVVDGQCRLSVDGVPSVVLSKGDFVLLPATPAFTMSSLVPTPPKQLDAIEAAQDHKDEVRHGRVDGPPDVRLRGGYFAFGSPDAGLLVSLLPTMIHIHGVDRFSTLVSLFGEEAEAHRPGRDLVLSRLVEILLVEALRAVPGQDMPPCLLRGLADARVAKALHHMHGDTERVWTVDALAKEAGLSRSAFFDRFSRVVGMRPMEYLLSWRMAVAKDLLRSGPVALDEVARRIGYGSASTFSTAFSRHVGIPPGRFARSG